MSIQISNDDVADLPPSAKLVYLILQEGGEMTQAELRDRTTLPDRTVRYALERLDAAGVLRSRPSASDARQSLYSIN
ncbi:MarR family transcriptional regulator [Halostagnicola sp. A56]|uniref:helix-turn-helix domain-containing protein n=1 Tax=Halostagnicola sp. A56 TaxID=1495067 RepID=UPI0009E39D64|nr:MarR family transcriptional regulator [Halostagnicola sp. A56]